MPKLRIALPVAILALALGVWTVSAQTTATQNITFSVPAVVSITSNGTVAAGTLTGTTGVTGSFALSSNDPGGFNILTSTPTATVTESGCASPLSSFSVANVKFAADPVTGATTGTTGAGPGFLAYSTTPTSVYTTQPTAQGTAMTLPVEYQILASSIPANTSTCTYVFPTTWTITAN